VRLVFQGIRRTLGSAPDQKNAAITAEVRAMVETLSPTSAIGVRNRALLLVGFAGAFRRSELVSLDVADVTFNSDGLIVTLRRGKTDQEGLGRKVGLPFGSNPLTCPVRALRGWLDVAAIASGPVFRSVDRHANVAQTRLTDQSVALIVKRCAKAAGLEWERYAGHSLRSGLATAAAMADVSERAIMAQTGHYVGDRRQGAVDNSCHDAFSWSRASSPSKMRWRPSWPLAAASSRWRSSVGRNSMVVWKKVQDSQMDSKWQSSPMGRAQ
jgi:integrase